MSLLPKAVVAVILPREHLPFLREWCEHHLSDGWRIFLYDNTGSVASSRKTSSFFDGGHQQARTDKRGNHYGAYTKNLTDADVQARMKEDLAGIDVTIIPWQPTDETGRIVHGQVEAHVDFIRSYRKEISWAAFIDADEYLYSAPGYEWDHALRFLDENECHRLRLEGVMYESRWTPDGQPGLIDTLRCCGRQKGGYKNIVRPDQTVLADIHSGWRMRGANKHVSADPFQFHFKHYRASEPQLLFDSQPAPTAKQEIESLPVDPGELAMGAPPVDLLSGFWKISPELEHFILVELPPLLPDPQAILELGPGRSTRALADAFPLARILSLEHDAGWLECVGKFLRPCPARIELRHAPIHAETRWYDISPENLGLFDLLLVDGPPGQLGRCVRAQAVSLVRNLRPGSLVLLDDTNRPDEQATIPLWMAKGFEILILRKTFAVLRSTRITRSIDKFS